QQDFDSGWIFFDINYTENTYASSLTAQCLNKENATLLEWEGVSVISPTITPTDYSPNLTEGSVYLEPNSSVLWNKQFINQTESALNFPTPYMAVYSGSLYQQTFNIDMVFQFTVQPNSTETQTQRIDSKYFILSVVYNDPTGVSQMSYSSNTVTITVRNNGTSVSSFVARPLVTYVEYMGGVVVKQQGSTNNLQISYNGSQNMFEVTVGTTSKYFASMTRDIEKYIFFVKNTEIELWGFNSNNERIYTKTVEFPEIGNITSLEILGGRTGAVFHSVSVYQSDGSNILPLYQNADFEPVWNDDNYDLYMTANFTNNLEGGTGSVSGNGFVIYRREIGSNVLTPIANLSPLITSLKDYGIRSRKAYEYLLGVY
ncbi:MAG: hypothetical protein K2O54_08160, partial [Prevotella sp.]|nr:hypothetical protein [Prevotella sp.]